MRFPILASTAMIALMIALPASAATAKKPTGGAATGAHIAKGDTVDERIQNLHDSLKITADEEDKWKAVADAMRENAAKMEKMVADKKANKDTMTAKEDLENYQEFAQAHVDGLKNLRDDFDALYDSMPDEQKKLADKVFAQAKQ